MAFAQFYYDPALEFEKLLDDDVPAPVVPANAHESNKASGGGGDTSAVVKGPAGAAGPGGAIARSASMGAEPQPGQDCSGHAWSPSRWFSEGLLKRRASTGSINGGPHPGIPK